MNNVDIVRAWKDEEYRNSLSAEQKAQLPEDPSGMIDITDEEFDSVMGGWPWGRVLTVTAECRCPHTLTGQCRCPF